MSRYDILIVDIRTGRVDGIAELSVREDSVGSVLAPIIRTIRPHMLAIARPAGEFRKGDAVEVDIEVELSRDLPKVPRKAHVPGGETYTARAQERIANGQCINCGSPQLFTTRLCEPCNVINNERSARSSAHSL